MRTLLKCVLAITLSTMSMSISNFAMAGPTEDGMRALQAQDFSSAKSAFLLGASQGDVQSQVFLAMMYEKGLGVTKSNRQAGDWYCKAAQKGHAQSLVKAKILVPEKQCAKPTRVTGKTLDAKTMFEHGQTAARKSNYTMALKWYHKAADQGDKDAMMALGGMYKLGKGVPVSQEKAIYWFKKAAAKGDVMAQMTLQTYGITEW